MASGRYAGSIDVHLAAVNREWRTIDELEASLSRETFAEVLDLPSLQNELRLEA